MDEALIDQSLSFGAFRSARERFLVERAAEAALVRNARRAHESRHDPGAALQRTADASVVPAVRPAKPSE